MNELSLFSGAGGGILGSVLLGWRTVCAVEYEPYAIAVLVQRQNDGVLPPFPIWDDVRTFDGRPWRGIVDVVSGGFPCQPFSAAGKQNADADERNLWPETIRIISEVRPHFAFLENVSALLSVDGADGRKYFGRILGDLAEIGYDAEWTVLGADDCGAPHRRKRVWILAHARSDKHIGEIGGVMGEQKGIPDSVGAVNRHGWRIGGASSIWESYEHLAQAIYESDHVADAARVAEREPADPIDAEPNGGDARTKPCGRSGDWWERDPADADGDAAERAAIAWRQRRFGIAESRLGRVANGVAHRVDRLKAIGNGQVPEVAASAWRELYARIGMSEHSQNGPGRAQ